MTLITINAKEEINRTIENKSTVLNLVGLELENAPKGTVVSNMEQLESIKKLYLSSNEFTFIPVCLCELKRLALLDFANNKLTGVPAEIGQLTNLTELSLKNNKIESLPPEIANLKKLTHLRLSNNLLTSLPAWIGELKSLTWLDIGLGNSLTSLPLEILQLEELKVLYLKGTKISQSDPVVEALEDANVKVIF